MADPRQICFDILGKLKIPDPDDVGNYKTVVYQGTSPQFANYRTGLKKPRQVREYVIQTPSNTGAQLTQRSFMLQAVSDWQAADQTERNRAAAVAKTRMLPLYQAYLSMRIKELIQESEDTMWQDAFPVGSIYINTTTADPNTFMGFGTWENFAAGRVLVGLDDGVAPFDTLGDTGGEVEHTLTSGEMPSHTHTQDSHNHTQDSHNHTQNSHTHTQYSNTAAHQAGGANNNAQVTTLGANTGGTTATNIATTATNQATTATNQNTGGGSAHNNLQPFIVVSIWQRTA